LRQKKLAKRKPFFLFFWLLSSNQSLFIWQWKKSFVFGDLQFGTNVIYCPMQKCGGYTVSMTNWQCERERLSLSLSLSLSLCILCSFWTSINGVMGLLPPSPPPPACPFLSLCMQLLVCSKCTLWTLLGNWQSESLQLVCASV
jgi:hypothetical protein